MSHEEGELSLKIEKLQNNGHGTEAKLVRTVDRHSYADNTSKSRFYSLIVHFFLNVFMLFSIDMLDSCCIHNIFFIYMIDRSISPSPKRRSNNRSRSSPSLSPKVRNDGRSPRKKTSDQSPGHKAPDPSASNRGRDLSQSPTPDGAPKRIRKGRGFTERYSFARRYRTPERSPSRSFQYGGRNFERNRDR